MAIPRLRDRTRLRAHGDSLGEGYHWVPGKDGQPARVVKDGGYPIRLASRLQREKRLILPQAKVELQNHCVSGHTSHQLLTTRGMTKPTDPPPHIFTLCIGANDLIRGVTPELFRSHLSAVVSALTGGNASPATPEPRVLLCTVPDFSRVPEASQDKLRDTMTRERVIRFKDVVSRIGDSHGLPVVDLVDVDFEVCMDGLHPSKRGYDQLAERMWKPLAELAGLPPKDE
jgi:lysophospholipase L1-like esterase